jgi:hypothetical protein
LHNATEIQKNRDRGWKLFHGVLLFKELIMKAYILARAAEPSSWRGLILLLTAIGVPIAPSMAEAIITIGLGVAGVIGVATPDK